MKNREVGRKSTFLVKLTDNTVVAAVEFVDDYRPKLNVDRRYVKMDKLLGCIWYSDRKNFNTREEGNELYTQLKAEGYVAGTEEQVEAFIRRAANLTY